MKIVEPEFNSFVQMLELLPDEQACRNFLELVRWDNIPTCPHCGSVNETHYKLKVKGEFTGLYKCKDCRERFTVTVGTIFEGSHIPLRKWFIGVYIFASHKKGISSVQLGKDLDITQKSAWFMLGRIRYSFKPKSIPKITKPVQVDETFVGGKNENRHKDKKVPKSQGRSTKDKTPVFGIMSDGQVNTEVVPNTQQKTLQPIIKRMVEKGTIVVSDEWGGYNGLGKQYNHKVVKHNEDQFVKDGFHTNGIEGFWSLLKRGIFGIYHHVSRKHLNEYCDEFAFRYNTRGLGDADRFSLSLGNVSEKISYKKFISKE